MEFNATFIIAIFSFSVFILVMNRIYYKPVLNIINERKNLINGNYEHAKKSIEKADLLLKEKEQRLSETSQKAKSIVAKKVDETTLRAASAASGAQKQSQAEILRTKENLALEEQQISSALEDNIKDLARSITAKILGGAS
ncbi:MAG: ATP synthase F0 subunit B [Heliobacteriaceae bacterium]|jgi:F-type H+-transporting ATPase subunit b|nr:ATP synthase F0 subunit B [Heliobacteriaceae bacterium]